ncbi:molybdopterin-dependent oxidoreductase [Cognatishimia sp. F0-27]|uniref:molybdopterin-dependent oxidoreductase n=1 Tax=Cognatishimia sp. F0-27 TaxID=2816855 RepID=UPI001D0C8039|nr:molybdopterin-dependent oxidoreductase [Cognatishimia sp. F0-27]MCC1494993.1 molybdopterin-dependent oxidoreductase [Cognatishimia sp. F0-27]
MRDLFFRLVLVVVALMGGPLHAVELPEPRGPVVLTITFSNDLSQAAQSGPIALDREAMASLDWQEIVTHTSFTEGPQRFAGPTLASLLEALNIRSGSLRAQAINDYSVTIPVEHAWRHAVLLAMEHNGARMRVRDKGPIWVVYPLEAHETDAKPFDHEMIWQLNRLSVHP